LSMPITQLTGMSRPVQVHRISESGAQECYVQPLPQRG
jgi:hypothetical protein